MSFNQALEASFKELTESKKVKTILISEPTLDNAARKMESVGYILSKTPNSRRALKEYLCGNSLYLAGTVGAGKTEFFRALSRSGVAQNKIAIYSLSEHGDDHVKEISEDIRALDDYELVVDDLGMESDWSGNRTKAEVIQKIMAIREHSRRRTHYTTNLDSEMINQYGERVKSRLSTCVKIAMVSNVDNRAPKVNEAELQRQQQESQVIVEEESLLDQVKFFAFRLNDYLEKGMNIMNYKPRIIEKYNMLKEQNLPTDELEPYYKMVTKNV